MTVYNAVGTPIDAQIRWGKTSNATGAETWSAYYLRFRRDGCCRQMDALRSGVTFDNNGRMTAPASGSISTTFTVDGSTSGTLDFVFGPPASRNSRMPTAR